MKTLITTICAVSCTVAALHAAPVGVDPFAENYRKGSMADHQSHIEQLLFITDNGSPREQRFQSFISALGLSKDSNYERSSSPHDGEWINATQIELEQNQGTLGFIFDSKYQEQVVSHIAPAGSDLVVQCPLNFSHVESKFLSLLASLMDKSTVAKFSDQLDTRSEMLDMTYREILSNLDLRVNLIVDLDSQQQIPTFMGSFDTPKTLLRLDGIHWIWEQLGPQLLVASGLPFTAKQSPDGTITFSLPDDMARSLRGFLPVITADPRRDHVWIASHPQFMQQCRSGQDSLAESPEYLAAMNGLPAHAPASTYLSSYCSHYIAKLLSTLSSNGMLEHAKPAQILRLQQTQEILAKTKHGFAATLSKNHNGILSVERHVQSIEEQMAAQLRALGTASTDALNSPNR